MPTGRGQVYCRVDDLPLSEGSYSINVAAQQNSFLYDWVGEATTLDVTVLDYYGNGEMVLVGHSPLLIKSNWTLGTLPNYTSEDQIKLVQ